MDCDVQVLQGAASLVNEYHLAAHSVAVRELQKVLLNLDLVHLRQPKMLAVEVADLEKKVKAFAMKPDNWDGYGALKISEDVKWNALSAIKSALTAAPMPEVTPNPNGTISYEWDSVDGDAHLEIGKTKYSFYIRPRHGNKIFSEGPATQIDSDIGRVVAELLYPSNFPPATVTPVTPIDSAGRVRAA